MKLAPDGRIRICHVSLFSIVLILFGKDTFRLILPQRYRNFHLRFSIVDKWKMNQLFFGDFTFGQKSSNFRSKCFAEKFFLTKTFFSLLLSNVEVEPSLTHSDLIILYWFRLLCYSSCTSYPQAHSCPHSPTHTHSPSFSRPQGRCALKHIHSSARSHSEVGFTL